MKNTNGCNEMIVRWFNTKGFLYCLVVMTFAFMGGFFVCKDTFAYNISVSTSGAQSINVSPDSSNIGTNINEDAITVTTTCRSGYNFGIGTSVNNNNLYLNGDSTNNAEGKYFTPSNGTTALDNAPNTWGYYYDSAVTPTAPTKSSVFSAVPALGSTPATIKSTLPTPSSTDITDNFSIYYGVAVSSNLTPGAYKMIPDTNNNNANGTMIYYVTMAESCLPYTVVFSPVSTSGTGTGTMADQIIPRGEATALNSNAFTAPTGYEFNGWNTAQDGTGTSYTDGQSVTDIATGNSTITLYAQWKQSTVPMQTWDFSQCAAMNAGDTIDLMDNRDNTIYKVGKLADGNCWMLDNLALDLTNADVQTNLTTDTTNATAQALSCLKTGEYNGSTCSSPYTAYAVAAATSTNYYDRPAINTASINVKPSNPPTSGAGSNLVGVYYNYCAATAGSYCYSSSSSTGDAQYDVCPKGWHLPTGNSSGDYGLLYSTSSYNYNTYDKFKNALSLPLSGYFYSGQAFNQGSGGRWWSSTRTSNSFMYGLYLDTSSVYTTDSYNRRSGYSVRCVKTPAPSMQEQTSESLAQLMPNTDDTVTLRDSRDDTEYKVARLADGNYWMLDNLALDITNSSVQSNLTTDTTNATDEALSCLKTGQYNGTTCSSPYTAYAVAAATSTNYYNRPAINTASINVKPSNPPTSGAGSNLVGVYYNYCAATAGSYCYRSSSSTGNAQYDVCPKGWHLPTGNFSGQFGTLYSTSSYGYNTYDKFKNALSLPLSGYFYNGSARDQGSDGYWWSSTRTSNYDMYSLDLDTSSVSTTRSNSRGYGNSVRCVRSS